MYFIKFLKDNKFFVAIITLVHVVFYLLALHYKKIYMGDSSEYIYEAINIRDLLFFYSGNANLPIDLELTTQRQPLYPLYLFLFYFLTTNNWIVLIVQNIFSILNVLYAYKILKRLGFPKRLERLFLIFVIAYPCQFINANTIAPDILLQTFVLLYVGNFIELVCSKNTKSYLNMSLVLAAGMFVKPVLYPFIVPHLLILLGNAIRQKAKIQRVLVIALIPFVAVLLYNCWNLTRTGKFHFSSNQAFNAIYYYYPYVSEKYGIDSANNFIKKERSDIASFTSFAQRYDFANTRGMQLLKDNFIHYSIFHLKSSFRIFIEPGKAELDLFTGNLTYGRLYSKQPNGFYSILHSEGIKGVFRYVTRNSTVPLIFIVFIFNCIKVIGFVLFLLKRDSAIMQPIKFILAVLIFYFAIIAGPIANTRYFLPVSLLFCSCAVLGYNSLLLHYKSRRQR